MTSKASQTLAERAEIHKSCKTLETVINVFNDYCEAVNAILLLQKKLARALRDAASVKCVSEIPSNALNASATIFETLSDVDGRFAKLADKECDAISSDVKKWFKKLAKEEKSHDDRIAAANARIKQAGEFYERKVKKNPQGAADEHTRYINVLSILGPEITQEKQNHAVYISQKHSAAMYIVAACLARVANGQWLRSCDGVRQFSPTVGQLGQWRAFCEGGWSGAIPERLPENDASQTPTNSGMKSESTGQPPAHTSEEPLKEQSDDRNDKLEPNSRRASEQDRSASSRAVTPSSERSPSTPPHYSPAEGEQSVDKSASLTPGDLSADSKNHSSTSLASLASFPSPPTHFPIPPITNRAETSEAENKDNDVSQPIALSVSDIPFPQNSEAVSQIPVNTPRTESPLPMHRNQPSIANLSASTAQLVRRVSKRQPDTGQTPSTGSAGAARDIAERQTTVEAGTLPRVPIANLATLSDLTLTDSVAAKDHPASEKGSNYSQHRSNTSPLIGVQSIERSDTGKSNGSVVASLRERYARTAEPSTAIRKETPRLPPTSVSKIANQYESAATFPTSPVRPLSSSVNDRRRYSVDMSRQVLQSPRTQTFVSGGNYITSDTVLGPASDVIALRRQRIAELEDLEFRQHELELKLKEREIEQRAQELELERARILNRGDVQYGSDATMLDRLSQQPVSSVVSSALARPRYNLHSLSATNLSPPLSTQNSSQTGSQPSSPQYMNSHPPFCECQACSAAKYADRKGTSYDPRAVPPIGNVRQEKPRGWIRRLSMPMINGAFSLDSKKGVSSAGIAGGPGPRNSTALIEEDGRLRIDATGGIKNRSSTNVARW